MRVKLGPRKNFSTSPLNMSGGMCPALGVEQLLKWTKSVFFIPKIYTYNTALV